MVTRSTVRALVRAGVVLVMAFGLGLTAEQVAAVQVFTEAVLQIVFKGEK